MKQRPVSRSVEKEQVHTQTGVQASTTGTSKAEAQATKKYYIVQSTIEQECQNQHRKRVHQSHQQIFPYGPQAEETIQSQHPETQLQLHAQHQAFDRWPQQSNITECRNSRAVAGRREENTQL